MASRGTAGGEPEIDLLVDRMLIGDVDKCTEMLIRELRPCSRRIASCFMNLPGVSTKDMRSMELFSTRVMRNVEQHFGG